VQALNLTDSSDEALFTRLFPDQVNPGSRQSKTWQWILTRIEDGNGIKPPRNLIDLIIKARDAQARREEREGRNWPTESLFEADALRKALEALSDQRVNDTLLAENSALTPFISKNSEMEKLNTTMSHSERFWLSIPTRAKQSKGVAISRILRAESRLLQNSNAV